MIWLEQDGLFLLQMGGGGHKFMCSFFSFFFILAVVLLLCKVSGENCMLVKHSA